MRVQLPRGVELEPREEQKSFATNGHHGVLHARRLGIARLEESTHLVLVAFGLLKVLAVVSRELLVARDIRCRAQLRQRLHFDRMRVRQVLRQLVVEICAHVDSLRRCLYPAPRFRRRVA